MFPLGMVQAGNRGKLFEVEKHAQLRLTLRYNESCRVRVLAKTPQDRKSNTYITLPLGKVQKGNISN
jgi:hypothetical protein